MAGKSDKCVYILAEKKILRKIAEQCNTEIKQGDQGWKDLRKKCIGCSEIGTVLNQNMFRGIGDLLKDKLNITNFRGNFYTLWGNFFEPIITSYASHLFGTIIYGQNSFFPPKDGLACSPDGLAVVSRDFIRQISGEVIEGEDDACVALFEFKCPLVRNIKSGQISDNYEAQVQGGMSVINLPEIGIFCEANFRRCHFSDLDWTNQCVREEYGPKLNIDSSGRTTIPRTGPISIGFTIIYCADGAPTKKFLKTLQSEGFVLPSDINSEDGDINDFGQASSFLLMELFKQIINKKAFSADLSYLFIDEANMLSGNRCGQYYEGDNPLEQNIVLPKASFTPEKVAELLAEISARAEASCPNKHGDPRGGHKIFGILPWKLYRFNHVIIKRDGTRIDGVKSIMGQICDFVNENLYKKKEEKLALIDEFMGQLPASATSRNWRPNSSKEGEPGPDDDPDMCDNYYDGAEISQALLDQLAGLISPKEASPKGSNQAEAHTQGSRNESRPKQQKTAPALSSKNDGDHGSGHEDL